MDKIMNAKRFDVIAAQDLEEYVETKRKDNIKRGTWGNWKYYKSNNTLRFMPVFYEIDLDDLNTAEDFLHKLAHMIGKNWVMSSNNLADMINAIRDIQNISLSSGIYRILEQVTND